MSTKPLLQPRKEEGSTKYFHPIDKLLETDRRNRYQVFFSKAKKSGKSDLYAHIYAQYSLKNDGDSATHYAHFYELLLKEGKSFNYAHNFATTYTTSRCNENHEYAYNYANEYTRQIGQGKNERSAHMATQAVLKYGKGSLPARVYAYALEKVDAHFAGTAVGMIEEEKSECYIHDFIDKIAEGKSIHYAKSYAKTLSEGKSKRYAHSFASAVEAINKRDKEGYPPLMRAVFERDEKKVKDLLGKGADPNVKSFYGLTALGYLRGEKDCKNIKKLLIAAGGNKKDARAYTRAEKSLHRKFFEWKNSGRRGQ